MDCIPKSLENDQVQVYLLSNKFDISFNPETGIVTNLEVLLQTATNSSNDNCMTAKVEGPT